MLLSASLIKVSQACSANYATKFGATLLTLFVATFTLPVTILSILILPLATLFTGRDSNIRKIIIALASFAYVQSFLAGVWSQKKPIPVKDLSKPSVPVNLVSSLNNEDNELLNNFTGDALFNSQQNQHFVGNIISSDCVQNNADIINVPVDIAPPAISRESQNEIMEIKESINRINSIVEITVVSGENARFLKQSKFPHSVALNDGNNVGDLLQEFYNTSWTELMGIINDNIEAGYTHMLVRKLCPFIERCANYAFSNDFCSFIIQNGDDGNQYSMPAKDATEQICRELKKIRGGKLDHSALDNKITKIINKATKKCEEIHPTEDKSPNAIQYTFPADLDENCGQFHLANATNLLANKSTNHTLLVTSAKALMDKLDDWEENFFPNWPDAPGNSTASELIKPMVDDMVVLLEASTNRLIGIINNPSSSNEEKAYAANDLEHIRTLLEHMCKQRDISPIITYMSQSLNSDQAGDYPFMPFMDYLTAITDATPMSRELAYDVITSQINNYPHAASALSFTYMYKAVLERKRTSYYDNDLKRITSFPLPFGKDVLDYIKANFSPKMYPMDKPDLFRYAVNDFLTVLDLYRRAGLSPTKNECLHLVNQKFNQFIQPQQIPQFITSVAPVTYTSTASRLRIQKTDFRTLLNSDIPRKLCILQDYIIERIRTGKHPTNIEFLNTLLARTYNLICIGSGACSTSYFAFFGKNNGRIFQVTDNNKTRIAKFNTLN
jgi:hypothetical protein